MKLKEELKNSVSKVSKLEKGEFFLSCDNENKMGQSGWPD